MANLIKTYLDPSLSVICASALLETKGNEEKALALIAETLADEEQRAQIIQTEFRYAARAFCERGQRFARS